MERKKYDLEYARNRYKLIVDDMLYNIIVNLRNNNLTFDDLAEDLGITTEELFFQLTNERKDFFVQLESICILEKKNIYKSYSRLNKKKN